MPSIVPIVEGDGEVTARPELLLKRENFRLFSPRVWPKRKQDKIWSACRGGSRTAPTFASREDG